MSDFDPDADNDELWQHAAEAENPNDKVDTLVQMAFNALGDEDFRDALVWATAAVEAAKACTDEHYPAYANHCLANAAVKCEEWKQALEACAAAYPYYQGNLDELALTQLENLRAQSLEGLDQYGLAIEAHRTAYGLAISIDDQPRAGWAALQMSIALNHEGRSVEALEILEKSGEAFKKRNMMTEFGFTRDMCGESYHRLGMPKAALPYFDEAHTIFEFTNTEHLSLIMDYKAGRSLITAGKPKSAIELLTKAQQRLREKKMWNYAAECQAKIGLAWALLGELDRATATLEQARVLLSSQNMPESSLRVAIYLAQLSWLRGDRVTAFQMYEHLLKHIESDSQKVPFKLQFKIVQGFARLCVLNGRPELALSTLKSWSAWTASSSIEHNAETLVIEAQALRMLDKLAPAERIAKQLIAELAPEAADHVLAEAHEVAYAIDLQRGRKAAAGNHLMMATALHNKLGNTQRAALLTEAFLGDGLIDAYDAGPSGGLALDDTPFDTAEKAASRGKKTPALWDVDESDSNSDVE